MKSYYDKTAVTRLPTKGTPGTQKTSNEMLLGRVREGFPEEATLSSLLGMSNSLTKTVCHPKGLSPESLTD